MVQGKAMQIVDMSNPNADKITSASTKNVSISNKQSMTAVEWLIKELSAVLGPIKTEVIQDLFIVDIIKEAKQMEKEQIEDAHIEGQRVFDKHPHTQWTNDQAEQYYNETYGK